MKTKQLTFLLALTFVISMLASCAEPPSPPSGCAESPSLPLEGWRYPCKSDMKYDWDPMVYSLYSSWFLDGAVPYHFTADLNGDGLSDDAWILVPTLTNFEAEGFSIFVFFNQKKGPPIIVENIRTGGRQGWAIHELKPMKFEGGDHKMEYSGIVINWAESIKTGIYWDKKTSSFVEVFSCCD